MFGENVYAKLSSQDKDAIIKYIKAYADIDAQGIYKPETEPMASLRNIMTPWRMAKSEYLYDLFGEELILSKEIVFELSKAELTENCDKMMYGYGKPYTERESSPVCQFVNQFKSKLIFTDLVQSAEGQRIWETKTGLDAFIAAELGCLLSASTLATNVWTGKTFEIPNPKTGKPFKVQNGCKVVKTLVKIAEMYDIPGAEEFRTAHSQVLNQKKIKGNLCLSIHPLDYMTMSDNACDWDSCMSWWNSGAYRQGTVEMMNSSCVVVAYLESSNDMVIPGGHHWNSKKWRELYIVTPDFITNIKGYPYENTDLSMTVVDWLKELAEKNTDWDLSPKKYTFNGNGGGRITEDILFEPCTNTMYNDFDNSDTHFAYLSQAAENWDCIEINYSGPSQCMWCGKTRIYIDSESQLLCDKCESHWYCDLCGERMTEYEYHNNVVDGMHVCDYCHGERFVTDCVTGNLAFDEDCDRLSIVYKDKLFTDLDLYIGTAFNSYEGIIAKIGSHNEAKLWRIDVKYPALWGSPGEYFERSYIAIKFEDINEDNFEYCSWSSYEEFKEDAEQEDSSLVKYHSVPKEADRPWRWMELT